ncbi:MAG: GHMP kinase [Ktedonobacteraceae bacterium]|nr:GHMP kinase [Ktedonobacteraceae bacterium]
MLIVRAPFRISFGGGGTDLAAYYTRFGGFVVSAAITRYCYVIADQPTDGGIHINSADYRLWETYPRGMLPTMQEPLALPKAAIAWFAKYGLLEKGVNLFLSSEVPPGTGLGSSSAMAVALVQALSFYLARPIEPLGVAELACWLEIEQLGMPIGKQDQYASACGGLNAIHFTDGGVRVIPLDLSANVVTALSSRLLLFSTGQTRNSAAILCQQRADTQSDPATVASLHRIKALAEQMREALLAGHLDHFGQLLDLAWCEKRNLSEHISTTVIDCWYKAARQAGALGGKITGAGGGGFLLLYCPLPRQEAVRATMAHMGLREMTFDLDFMGTQAWRPQGIATTIHEETEKHV